MVSNSSYHASNMLDQIAQTLSWEAWIATCLFGVVLVGILIYLSNKIDKHEV